MYVPGPAGAAPHQRGLIGRQGGDVQGGRRADRHGVVHGRDVQDVPRLAVGGRGADAQALALADREAERALVAAEDRAGLVDDVALRLAQAVREEALGVAVGDEADVVRVRLLGDGEATVLGLRADLVLRGERVAEREERVRELTVVKHTEDVRLVLGHVGGAVQLARAVVAHDHLGVVAGADRVEAEGEGLVEQGRELDLLVAAQAGVRGAAGLVLGDEVLDHVLAEALGEVPHVERDADDVRGAAGVARVLDGATATRARAERLRVRREGEVDSGHVMPCFRGAGGGDGGVHAAGHGGQYAEGGALRGLSHNPSRVRVRGNRSPRVSVRLDMHDQGGGDGQGRGPAHRAPCAAHRRGRGRRGHGRAGPGRDQTYVVADAERGEAAQGGRGRLPGRALGGGVLVELADGGPARRLRHRPRDHPCHTGQLRRAR